MRADSKQAQYLFHEGVCFRGQQLLPTLVVHPVGSWRFKKEICVIFMRTLKRYECCKFVCE